MPFLTNWLEMPSATPEPGPSLFEPPALRSIGARPSRRESMLEQRDAQAAQKMAAYQAATRKMEMQKLAADEARAVLPVLQSLDPTAPDYQERRGQLLSQFPLSAEDPSVSNVARAHDTMLMGIRQKREAAAREDAEDEKMLADDPILQQVFAQKAKIEGPEAARAAIRAKRFNDAQALRLIELGEDPDNPKFKIDDQYFDKRQIDILEARKKGGGGGGKIPQGAAEAYQKAIGLANSGIPEDEKAGKFMLNFLDAQHPELRNFDGSSLPESKASDTSGGFSVTPKTTREEIAKLPSGTKIVMPDGTIKFKK